MKVLNLRCANGHGFEGWFASEEDFLHQNGGSLIECPLCADKVISRLPAAPRLNLSGAREPASASAAKPANASAPASASASAPVKPQHADLLATWLASVRELMAKTENVGNRFAEEARRIHYGEVPHRGIRGQASFEERQALQEEGIETLSIPVPRALDGPVQ